MARTYAGYILPSMVALTLSGVSAIVDGIFVGHAVGDAGLAGINVAYPLLTLVMAAATGMGMGGAVICSIEQAKGHTDRAQRALGNTFILLALVTAPLMALLLTCARPLCALLGGSGETLNQAATYIGVLAWGVPFQVFSNGSLPLIRNRGGVNYAMVTQVVASMVNIALDYVLVVQLGLGIVGAAWATVVNQAFAFCATLVFFLRAKNRPRRDAFRPEPRTMAHMARLGLAPFGLTLLPDVTVVIVNVNANAVGGEVAVATYAVISYVAFIAQMLIQGVADGSQPLVSTFRGQGDTAAMRRVRNTNYLVSLGIGIAGLAALTALNKAVPALFGASPETTALVAHAMPIYALSYLCYAFTHPSTSYFYAIDNARASTALVVGEAVLELVCVTAMSRLWGLDGIWASAFAAQALLGLLALVEFRLTGKAKKTDNLTFP